MSAVSQIRASILMSPLDSLDRIYVDQVVHDELTKVIRVRSGMPRSIMGVPISLDRYVQGFVLGYADGSMRGPVTALRDIKRPRKKR